MATEGRIPTLGFGAGAIAYVTLFGFSPVATTVAAPNILMLARYDPNISLAARYDPSLSVQARYDPGILLVSSEDEVVS